MINALEFACPFPTVFQEIENSGKAVPRYRRELGYIRADYDGRRWYNTIHKVHENLDTSSICREIDAVYDMLISEHIFPNLEALRSFCSNFPLARVNRDGDYDFYMEGALCWYWLWLITRDRDYKQSCMERGSCHCAYNGNGLSRFPMAYERQPVITEKDGCVEFVFREGQKPAQPLSISGSCSAASVYLSSMEDRTAILHAVYTKNTGGIKNVLYGNETRVADGAGKRRRNPTQL